MLTQNIPSCAEFWADSEYIFEKLMRSKTTKLRHERSNPNPNSRVVDFSECRHKIYHHVRNFELILNIFLKNWCGRRRPSYDMNDPTLTLTVGLWTFQNVDTKHTIMCGILSWFWIYFWKIDAVEDDQVRHDERSNPSPCVWTLGLWTSLNVDTKHTIMCGILSWF